MATRRLKINGLIQGGVAHSLTKQVKVPDFGQETRTLGDFSFTVNADQQLADYLSENYETLVASHWHAGDFDLIIDAEFLKKRVRRPKPNKIDEIKKILRVLFSDRPDGDSAKMIGDFMVVMYRMWEAVKSLPAEKIVHIVMEAQSVGYNSASNAFQHMVDFGKELDRKRLKDGTDGNS